MRNELVELLHTFGFPVFRQGSINPAEPYPDSFFTYWINASDDTGFYSGSPFNAIMTIWIYFYSTDFRTVETISESARELLRERGYIVQGKPTDAYSDVPTHTGVMFTAYSFERY